MSRPSGRGGHTLVELVVALPILALGGAVGAGLVLTASGILLQAEQRVHTAVIGSSLADSLRLAAGPEEAEGTAPLPGGEVGWSWDGSGTLILVLPGRTAGTDPPRWVLHVHGDVPDPEGP